MVQRLAIGVDPVERIQKLESGFCFYRDPSHGGARYGAVWSARDKLQKYDRPLRHKGRLEDRALNDGEIRCRGNFTQHIFGGIVPPEFRYVEMQPLAGLTFEGEPVDVENCTRHYFYYIGIVPDKNPGNHHCGGTVLATIYLAYRETNGLPAVIHAYISRTDSGELCLAIPA